MVFIGKARDGVVGLWFQIGRFDAVFGNGIEEREPSAIDQILDQSGDEHALASLAEAGDAEAHRWRDEIGRSIADASNDVGAFVGEVSEAQGAAVHGDGEGVLLI